MLCPYCGEEMGKGLVQSARTIFWSRKKKKLFFIPNESEGDVVIAGGANGSIKEAYLCKTCNKVTVDLTKE